MTRTTLRAARRLVALLLMGAAVGPAADTEALKARASELYEQRAEVRITLLDGSQLRGRVLRIDAESFTIRQKPGSQERALQYAQVKEITRAGLSRRTKAILIPVAIGGAVLLVLCAGPYPIGFLCRQDPS